MNNHKNLLQDIFLGCLQRDVFITTIESCTGGLISSEITNIAGSSKVFEKGFVTYSNKSKVQLLGISEETLRKYGAVSREVIIEMAMSQIKNNKEKNQITIATSGVAGPEKSEKKPVGLIWLACYRYDNLLVRKLDLGNLDRMTIRQRTVFEALALLKQNLKI